MIRARLTLATALAVALAAPATAEDTDAQVAALCHKLAEELLALAPGLSAATTIDSPEKLLAAEDARWGVSAAAFAVSVRQIGENGPSGPAVKMMIAADGLLRCFAADSGAERYAEVAPEFLAVYGPETRTDMIARAIEAAPKGGN